MNSVIGLTEGAVEGRDVNNIQALSMATARFMNEGGGRERERLKLHAGNVLSPPPSHSLPWNSINLNTDTER